MQRRFWQRRTTSRSRKYRDHHPMRLQILVGLVLLFLLAGIFAGVWYGSRVEAWQITEVRVLGGETIPADKVRSLAEAELAGNYLHLVPKRFRYSYPETAIAKAVRDLDRVEQVVVERSGEQTITIAFSEYVPVALWCVADATTDKTPCMFLDSKGYAFAKAPQLYGGAFLRYYHNTLTPEPEQTPFTPDFIEETQAFSAWLEETFAWYVTAISKINEFDTTYTLAQEGMIKVSNTLPRAVWQENLNTLLASAEMESIREGNFHYIDLRFGDKVFVNEELPKLEGASSTATSTASSTVITAE